MMSEPVRHPHGLHAKIAGPGQGPLHPTACFGPPGSRSPPSWWYISLPDLSKIRGIWTGVTESGIIGKLFPGHAG